MLGGGGGAHPPGDPRMITSAARGSLRGSAEWARILLERGFLHRIKRQVLPL